MLRAVKLWKSSSMCGPSATVKPIAPKIATTSSMVWLIGWMRPSGSARTGRVTSMRSVLRRAASASASSRRGGSGDRRLDLVLELVEGGAVRAPRLGVERAQPLHQLGHAAAPTERCDARLFQELAAVAAATRRRISSRIESRLAICPPVEKKGPLRPLVRTQGVVRRGLVRRSAAAKSHRDHAWASAAWACATTALKAAGSRAARSASTLRSSVMPARCSPCTNCA